MPYEPPDDEIKQLRRCLNDLVSVLTLHPAWRDSEPAEIAHSLLDTLLDLLRLDFVYIRLKEAPADTAIELVRVNPAQTSLPSSEEICAMLRQWFGDTPAQWGPLVRYSMGGGDISILPVPLGLEADIGVVAAGSRRLDFPVETETLLLRVASNQALLRLQEVRLLRQQKQAAKDLDQRIAQRTVELAAANEALKDAVAERWLMEDIIRKEELELKQSEARKTGILNSALDCIVTIDHEGHITEFNPAAERVLGYRRDEVLGKQLADVIIPPSLREQHRKGFARYLATGEAHVLGRRVEMTAVRADGREIPVELAITRIPLNGQPSFTGYLRDITERKQAEERLRRSEAFLAEAQRLSSTGSFSWQAATDELTWSEHLYRIFEFDREFPVTLQRIGERIHPDDLPVFHALVDRARVDGRDFECELRLQMPDYSIKYVHIIAHGIQEGRRQEYIGAVQEVTQRRLSEEALGKARSELAHVARVSSLGALAASIAHEVNQPLSGIITNASTCLRMLGADPPNVEGARETARRTNRDGNRASEIIARLRGLYNGKAMTPEPLDLNEAAREVIALSLSDLQRNRAVLRTEFADDLPQVVGDRVQLQQVVLNLLRNASDAMGTVDDRPRELLIKTERDGEDQVRLSVQDAGVGFDVETGDQLFRTFYTTKHDGMGIGLSVSRSIIESHHGNLWAARNDGPGVTFAFSVPCDRKAPAPPSGRSGRTDTNV